MTAEVYFDGGARPTNPGHASCGVLVLLENGERIRIGRYLGIKTNNEAEYIGLIVGLKIALDKGATEVVVTGDSKTVLEQVQGNWRCNHNHLRLLRDEAQRLAEKFYEVEWVHVRGHRGHPENEECDELATNAAKFGLVHRHNSNPFTVKALGEKKLEGEIVDPFTLAQ